MSNVTITIPSVEPVEHGRYRLLGDTLGQIHCRQSFQRVSKIIDPRIDVRDGKWYLELPETVNEGTNHGAQSET